MYQYYINPSIRPTIYPSILYIYLIYLKLKQNFNFFCFKTLSYFLNKKKNACMQHYWALFALKMQLLKIFSLLSFFSQLRKKQIFGINFLDNTWWIQEKKIGLMRIVNWNPVEKFPPGSILSTTPSSCLHFRLLTNISFAQIITNCSRIWP